MFLLCGGEQRVFICLLPLSFSLSPHMKVVQMSGWWNFGGTRLHGKYTLKFRPRYMENILESACFYMQFHKMGLNYQKYINFIWEFQNQEPCLGESEGLKQTWLGIFHGKADLQLGKFPEKAPSWADHMYHLQMGIFLPGSPTFFLQSPPSFQVLPLPVHSPTLPKTLSPPLRYTWFPLGA